MTFKPLFFLFLTNFFFLSLSAQETLVPLQSNPIKSTDKIELKTDKDEELSALELPFFEDFSHQGPYPDHKLWADSFVLVNSYYEVHPITTGVATFDALDQYGFIYEHEDIYQFVADHLTSNKIRLDSVFEPEPKALKPEDSLYISFYYQPQGKGLAPNSRDSLVLEFLHTPAHYYINDNEDDNSKKEDSNNNGDTVWVDDKWVSVWNAEGESLSKFSKGTFPYFKRVQIPIIDTAYFRDDFRFRFKNYSSFQINPLEPTNYAGNRSIWNIDYIKLDHGRSIADTFYYDIAFGKPAESILKKYTTMPWSHYNVDPESHLKSNFNVAIKNLNNIEHNYSYQYHIEDDEGSILKTYRGGTWNIAPFYQEGYQDYEAHSDPIVIPNPFPDLQTESPNFKIVHTIKEGATGDDRRRNDTIYYEQSFDNYFAYDNGISNAGYILEGYEPQAAVRHFLSHPDTLKGIDIFFNHTLDYQNEGPFKLMVWSSLDPEKVIYESEEVFRPEYADELNRFYTYEFEEDEHILLQDTFYIGWKQITNEELNVGFDKNNSARDNTFYNTHGQWMPSMFEGALMIRPIVSGKTQVAHVSAPEEPLTVKIYPNPIRDNNLHIKMDKNHHHDTSNMYIQVYDMNGRLVMNDKLKQTVSVQNLPNGTYIVRIFDKNSSESITKRIIISR